MQQANTIAKRRWGRAPAQVSARVFAMEGFMKFGPDINCRVVNISEGGALLEFPGKENVPDDFYLVIDAWPDRKIVCAAVHRRNNRIGVSFSLILPTALVKSLGDATKAAKKANS